MAKAATKKVLSVLDPETEPSFKDGGSDGGSTTPRRKFSVTLSNRSAEAFSWLKEETDADTDSEVVRNALRLHLVLLQQHKDGAEFFVRERNGSDLVKVNLFVSPVLGRE